MTTPFIWRAEPHFSIASRRLVILISTWQPHANRHRFTLGLANYEEAIHQLEEPQQTRFLAPPPTHGSWMTSIELPTITRLPEREWKAHHTHFPSEWAAARGNGWIRNSDSLSELEEDPQFPTRYRYCNSHESNQCPHVTFPRNRQCQYFRRLHHHGLDNKSHEKSPGLESIRINRGASGRQNWRSWDLHRDAKK